MADLNSIKAVGSTNIGDMARAVSRDLRDGLRVALGFESPIFVPVPRDPTRLGSKRSFEGNRPWSAGAGAAALATGLTEMVWVLRKIRDDLDAPAVPFTSWSDFQAAPAGIFLWEAFVTKQRDARKRAGSPHVRDAKRALQGFAGFAKGHHEITTSSEEPTFSLVGAALLRARWSEDLALLEEPCVVVSEKGVVFLPSSSRESRHKAHGAGNR
jgi:hypothetical protein